MKSLLNVGLVGDYEECRLSQVKTNEALENTAATLKIPIRNVWIDTDSLTVHSPASVISPFDAIVGSPGQYRNPTAAISAIAYCRKNRVPFLGT